MALREVRLDGDPVLRKVARRVEAFDKRLHTLLDDMAETMHAEDGVGLAAPQVGVRKRVVVIDVGEGLLELINPEIIAMEGSQCDKEGCLSIPERQGYVRRPAQVTVRAQDRNGELFEISGEELLAVAICHETDHLDGVLFTDREVEPTEEELAALEAKYAAMRAAMAEERDESADDGDGEELESDREPEA